MFSDDQLKIIVEAVEDYALHTVSPQMDRECNGILNILEAYFDVSWTGDIKQSETIKQEYALQHARN